MSAMGSSTHNTEGSSMAGRSRIVTRSTKRHGEWTGSTPQTSLAALAGSSAVLDQTFTPSAPGETLVRTRGLFGVRTDQQTASENIMGAVGIGIVSAQAVSVGITAIPHPDTDSSWSGWLWHQYFTASMVFGTAVGLEFQAINTWIIDSKAMRKVGDEERVVVVVENSSSTGMVYYISERLYSKPY